MSKFKEVIEFFQNLEIDSFVTRKMFNDALEIKHSSYGSSTESNIRCYLCRAGYLYDFSKGEIKSGVYRLKKKIPTDITLYQLIEEAYKNDN